MDAQIVQTLTERTNLLKGNAPQNNHYGADGNFMNFFLAINVLGAVFPPQSWQVQPYFGPAMSPDQYWSGEYDQLLQDLFQSYLAA